MKKIFALVVVSSLVTGVLSACTNNEIKTSNVNESDVNKTSEVVAEESNTTSNTDLQKVEILKEEILQEVDWTLVTDPLYSGERIVVLRPNEYQGNYNYFLYSPKDNGNEPFELNVAKDYEFTDETSVEVPLCINDNEEVTFILKLDFTINNDYVSCDKRELVFVNESDKYFNELVNKDVVSQEDIEYMYNLFDSEEEATRILKSTCLVDGINGSNIFKFIKFDLFDEKYLYELSLFYNRDTNFVLSDDNSYKPKVYNQNSYKDSYFEDVVDVVVKHAQTGESLDSLGVEVIEPNYTYDKFFKLETDDEEIRSYIENYSERHTPYILDFDGDGLDEVLTFDLTGSIPSWPVDIFDLDENGKIVSRDVYYGKDVTELYRYNDKYFFISDIEDYSADYEKKLRIYAVNGDEPFICDVKYETIGYETVLKEKNVEHSVPESVINEYLTNVDTFNNYNEYPTEVYSNNVEDLPEEVYNKFNESEAWNIVDFEYYSLIDVNNDGELDLVLTTLTNPATSYLGGIKIVATVVIDGKTLDGMDISYEDNGNNLRNIDVISHDGENYLMLKYGNENRHEFYLVQFEGTKMVVLEYDYVIDTQKINIEVLDEQL